MIHADGLLIDQRNPVPVHGKQVGDHRPRQHHGPGGAAKDSAGQEMLLAGAHVEITDTQFGQGTGGRVPRAMIPLGLTGQIDAAQFLEPARCRSGEGHGLVGQAVIHQRPPRICRATSMRCTSMVPLAIVAA